MTVQAGAKVGDRFKERQVACLEGLAAATSRGLSISIYTQRIPFGIRSEPKFFRRIAATRTTVELVHDTRGLVEVASKRTFRWLQNSGGAGTTHTVPSVDK